MMALIKSASIVFAILVATVLVVFVGNIIVTAVRMEMQPRPQAATVPVTSPEISENEEFAPELTGYYLEFPADTEDWRITYTSRLVEQFGTPDSRYAVIDAIYWCLIEEVWYSCTPIIRPVSFSDR